MGFENIWLIQLKQGQRMEVLILLAIVCAFYSHFSTNPSEHGNVDVLPVEGIYMGSTI
jgi:hypothetical protein